MAFLPKPIQLPWAIAPQKKAWNQNEDIKDYKSSRWVKLRKVHLSEHPYCVQCEKQGIVKLGRVVDHIQPVRLGGAMFDLDNLQTLCDSHHNSKSSKEQWQIESR